MSRRRGPKPPEQEPPFPGVRYISVVCTGRGGHPEQSLTTWQAWLWGDDWRVFVDSGDGDGSFYGPSLRRKCRQCGRHVVLQEDTVQRVGAELAALSEAPRLDISLIP